jgi:hypothetical protein
VTAVRSLADTRMPGSKGSIDRKHKDAFFSHAQERIGERLRQGHSQERIAGDWGISQNVLNRIKQGTGGMGVKALVGMRVDLGMTIDEILGLEPLRHTRRQESEPPQRSGVLPKHK